MVRDQYLAVAKALTDYKWILAAALSSASIELTKENKAKLRELSQLRDLIEAKAMETEA